MNKITQKAFHTEGYQILIKRLTAKFYSENIKPSSCPLYFCLKKMLKKAFAYCIIYTALYI